MQQQPTDTSRTAFLQRQYRFSQWRGTNRLTENLFIWRFFLIGTELPDWRPERVRTIAVDGSPPLLRSVWRGTSEATVSLEVFECASRLAAHDQVLELLGTIQSTEVRQDEAGRFGDVAFATPTDTLALFARANLAVFVRNAGPTVVPVVDVAAGFDQRLVERPSPGGAVVPEIRRLSLRTYGELRTGITVPLEIEAEDPAGRQVRYTIWTRAGEIRRDGDTLAYHAGPQGSDMITVYAVNESAGVAVSELNVEVRPPE
jgi:hypothetical protein